MDTQKHETRQTENPRFLPSKRKGGRSGYYTLMRTEFDPEMNLSFPPDFDFFVMKWSKMSSTAWDIKKHVLKCIEIISKATCRDPGYLTSTELQALLIMGWH